MRDFGSLVGETSKQEKHKHGPKDKFVGKQGLT